MWFVSIDHHGLTLEVAPGPVVQTFSQVSWAGPQKTEKVWEIRDSGNRKENVL